MSGCRRTRILVGIALATLMAAGGGLEPISIERNAEASLKRLYAKEPAAKTIAEKAKAILLFFNVLKAGFLGWAHYEGVLCGL